MYSPKINEEFIPTLYHIAKRKGLKMTQIVNNLISQYIKEEEADGSDIQCSQAKTHIQRDV